ncbi:O-antigen ligase [Sphingopyxis sp. C-1]|uniref:O-antigen ligase family protein n=1 Tax=Sphingopyxis sp. C-1 TaxID=262667 RepID=UPI000781E667|nr:O-antigen ligase family protein [Sphingopyxis sp. C-1]
MLRNKIAPSQIFSDYWIASGFLILLGLLGGSGRDDVQSLIFIRPLAILLAAYALWTLPAESWRHHRRALFAMGGIILVTLAYLVPLPPSLWQAAPGHSLIAAIDEAAGFGDIWRSYSIAPYRTVNALFSLAIPAATLLMMLRLKNEERWQLLIPIVVVGAISVMLALLQAAAPAAKLLWFYRFTNDGLPVGLFANRNHAAVFHACMLPMLAVAVQLPTQNRTWSKIRIAVAVFLGVATLIAVLASGSRAGLIAALLAIASFPFLLYKSAFKKAAPTGRTKHKARERKFGKLFDLLGQKWVVPAATIALLTSIGAATLMFSDSDGGTARRLSETSETEQRWTIWQESLEIAREFAPLGSGPGTFVEAYKIKEPINTLTPNYINHAHNDLVELLLTMGIIGAIFIVIAVFGLMLAGWRLRDRTALAQPSWQQNQARMAWTVLAILGAASIVDYPLRVPSLTALAVVMACWLGFAGARKRRPAQG